jgi:hypothetical protein
MSSKAGMRSAGSTPSLRARIAAKSAASRAVASPLSSSDASSAGSVQTGSPSARQWQ